LWPELIAAWELSSAEVESVNRQQGLACTSCRVNLRGMALARAILAEYGVAGRFNEFVRSGTARTLRVLEINRAGELTQFLQELPFHRLIEYPAFDMQHLPMEDGEFDLVIHSDTLEHVPDPLQGLRECLRVLKPEGRCIFTIPLVVGRLTRSCVGRTASYHGDTTCRSDYRVHTEFGADAWIWPIRAGFGRCAMHAFEHPTASALAAQKPSAATRNEMPDLGGRLLPSMSGGVVREHLHRYGMAQMLARGLDVLDIACGEGYGSRLMAEVARSVVGVDCDERVIRHASAAYSLPNLRYLVGDCVAIPVANASVDLVVSFETIEHIHDHAAFLSEITRVLRPSGVLLLSTPEREAYAQYSPPNPYHLRELTYEETVSLLKSRFAVTSWARQRLCFGSAVVPVEPPADTTGFYSITGDFEGMRADRGLTQAPYLVALATNGPRLPVLPWGVFEMPHEPPVLVQLEAQVRERRQLLNSRSWRYTAPLRWVSNLIRGRSR
jgi:2-polyprenyl-3-methyl-5-hydroxy-6-metoxy-1,4-benzoquinol methylase